MSTTENLEFIDNKVYRVMPLPQYGKDVCKKELIMDKKTFIECYNRWIKGVEDGNDDNKF